MLILDAIFLIATVLITIFIFYTVYKWWRSKNTLCFLAGILLDPLLPDFIKYLENDKNLENEKKIIRLLAIKHLLSILKEEK